MIGPETCSDSDNDKHNTHHKYTLDEALPACRNSMMKLITQVYLIRAHSEISIQRL